MVSLGIGSRFYRSLKNSELRNDMYQDATLPVAEELGVGKRFVSGHDFSRAELRLLNGSRL
jgi:hypothetical protein